tara:strand:- start:55 stop:585 length:531 start_codon:yes stop_codon:yes gene_type:complete
MASTFFGQKVKTGERNLQGKREFGGANFGASKKLSDMKKKRKKTIGPEEDMIQPKFKDDAEFKRGGSDFKGMAQFPSKDKNKKSTPPAPKSIPKGLRKSINKNKNKNKKTKTPKPLMMKEGSGISGKSMKDAPDSNVKFKGMMAGGKVKKMMGGGMTKIKYRGGGMVSRSRPTKYV